MSQLENKKSPFVLRANLGNMIIGDFANLDRNHGFHETAQGVRFTISETARREALSRLLKLNHERYEEEVRAGLHEKKKEGKRNEGGARKRSKKSESTDGQMELL